MKIQPFTSSFTQQEAIGDTAIAAAVQVMRTGRLHRYNTQANEILSTAKLEREYADFQQSTYCLACASGGYAMSISLHTEVESEKSAILTNQSVRKLVCSDRCQF